MKGTRSDPEPGPGPKSRNSLAFFLRRSSAIECQRPPAAVDSPGKGSPSRWRFRLSSPVALASNEIPVAEGVRALSHCVEPYALLVILRPLLDALRLHLGAVVLCGESDPAQPLVLGAIHTGLISRKWRLAA